MKVELTKDHLHNKKGDVLDVHEDQANYFHKMGVGKHYQEPKKKNIGKKEVQDMTKKLNDNTEAKSD